MVRKKIDNRLRILIENGVAEKHRSMFVVVGDHGRDQVRLTSGEFVSIWLNKVGQIRYDKSDWNLYINSRERMKQGQGYTMYIYNVDIKMLRTKQGQGCTMYLYNVDTKMLGAIVIVIVW